MASPNLSEIITTTLRNRSGKAADNVSRNNALLARLREKGKRKPFDGGRTIVQEIEYNMNQTYQRYSGYEVLNIQPSDIFTAAEFPIRQAAVAVTISGLEEIQNSGKEQIINLLEGRIANAERTFANGLSYDIYGDGTQPGQITGLQALVSKTPTTGVVGGIDRSQWVFWRNQVRNSFGNGVTLGPQTVLSEFNNLALPLRRGADGTDLIVADQTVYGYYLQATQAIQRITDGGGAKEGFGFTGLKYFGSGKSIDLVLDGGFQGFSTDYIPVGGAPTGTAYFLNTDYLFYRPHARRDMVPLNPDRVSVNQDAMVKLVAWAGNMTMSNAFLQGVLTAS
jgi:hypothetical protein